LSAIYRTDTKSSGWIKEEENYYGLKIIVHSNIKALIMSK